MSILFHSALADALVWLAMASLCAARAAKTPPSADSAAAAKRAVELAKTGQCKEALPLLKKSAANVTDKERDKDLKRDVGFAGVRCAMFADQPDAAIDFLRSLNHEFPNDPDVLYLSVHTYSDLSTRAIGESVDRQIKNVRVVREFMIQRTQQVDRKSTRL